MHTNIWFKGKVIKKNLLNRPCLKVMERFFHLGDCSSTQDNLARIKFLKTIRVLGVGNIKIRCALFYLLVIIKHI